MDYVPLHSKELAHKGKDLTQETEEKKIQKIKMTLTIQSFEYESKKYGFYLNGNEHCIELLSKGMVEERSI